MVCGGGGEDAGGGTGGIEVSLGMWEALGDMRGTVREAIGCGGAAGGLWKDIVGYRNDSGDVEGTGGSEGAWGGTPGTRRNTEEWWALTPRVPQQQNEECWVVTGSNAG